jgi:hypothetical protein
MLSKGSSSQSFLGLTPRVSHIHLDNGRVEEQHRVTQDELVMEREASRATSDSLAAYNALMQAFMAVRKKNIIIVFLTFSDMYVCLHFCHRKSWSSSFRMGRTLPFPLRSRRSQ